MADLHVLAIDMGSSSVRAILGYWDGRHLTRREILRVPHKAIGEPLEWDLSLISRAARDAVTLAAKQLGRLPDGVGVCGWGVDFVGVDPDNSPTTPARAYRGSQGAKGKIALGLDDWTSYQETGVFPQDINSFYQVAGLLKEDPDWFAGTCTIEFLADWVARDLASAQYGSFENRNRVPGWISTGVGSTAGFLNLSRTGVTDSWNSIGITNDILPSIANELSIVTEREGMAIIRAGSHDTACAAYSLGGDYSGLFLSCGSWAIAGAITEQPVVTESAFEAGVTNEATTDGRNRAQVNLTGMWLAQECRREWAQRGWKPSYAELDALTFAAQVPDGVIDVSHPELRTPGDMPSKIRNLAREELGIELNGPGELLALAQRSVAAASTKAISDLQDLTGTSGPVALLGGGVQDPYLVREIQKQLGANDLIVGDPESSALGNITAQLVTLGVDETDIATWRMETNSKTPESNAAHEI